MEADLLHAAKAVRDLIWQLPEGDRPFGLGAAVAELHRAIEAAEGRSNEVNDYLNFMARNTK